MAFNTNNNNNTGIIFDHPYGTYFAGDTVSGRIQLVLHKPKNLKGISLHIKGSASVRWTKQESRHVNGRTQHYTRTYYANEEYFKAKYYCLRSNDNETITLPVGTHVYPFSFVLPQNLPSSFEGLYGNIRYIAKFVLERPWKWNQETKMAFTVISPYDLNMFPNLLLPSKVLAEKFFCCCCCKSGPLTAVLMTPKTGYVCGERIPVIIDVDNISKNVVTNVDLRFQQTTSFYSQYPSKDVREDTKVLQKMKMGSVKPNDSKSWSQMVLIPPLPPCSLVQCSFIKSEYQLFLEVSAGAFHINLRLAIPVVIGTIPFRNETSCWDDRSPPPDYETAMGLHRDATGASSAQTPNPTAPTLQTFGENEAFTVKTIQDNDDNEHTKYTGAYTPFYPTYNFNYNQ